MTTPTPCPDMPDERECHGLAEAGPSIVGAAGGFMASGGRHGGASNKPQPHVPDTNVGEMPKEIWAIVHCGARGWTTRKDVAENAIQSAPYRRSDLAPTSQWQTMDSAPKDGRQIVGIDDLGAISVIRWSKHSHVPLCGWVRQIELYGDEVDGFDPVKWYPLSPTKDLVDAGKEGL